MKDLQKTDKAMDMLVLGDDAIVSDLKKIFGEDITVVKVKSKLDTMVVLTTESDKEITISARDIKNFDSLTVGNEYGVATVTSGNAGKSEKSPLVKPDAKAGIGPLMY